MRKFDVRVKLVQIFQIQAELFFTMSPNKENIVMMSKSLCFFVSRNSVPAWIVNMHAYGGVNLVPKAVPFH